MKSSKKKLHNSVVFKPYVQNQIWLLPPSLGDLIPANHIVRLVNEAIEGMDMSLILNAYEGGGASNYHPKMLLKALVYGYIEKLYSSRRIEKALQENICFMWLCGMQHPDHNTINRFRKGQLKNTVKDVFAQVLLYLIERGLVKIEDYHVDGTKMESVANRYTFMRMKEDHMKNGQLKPGYNIQIGTTNQFIVNYTLHQSTTDWPVFIPHMEDTAALLEGIGQQLPKRVIGDAGYGSEQNYDYITQKGIENYLKYLGFFREQKRSFKQNAFHTQNLHYNEKEDFYVCPMGQRLTYRYTKNVKSKLGYE